MSGQSEIKDLNPFNSPLGIKGKGYTQHPYPEWDGGIKRHCIM